MELMVVNRVLRLRFIDGGTGLVGVSIGATLRVRAHPGWVDPPVSRDMIDVVIRLSMVVGQVAVNRWQVGFQVNEMTVVRQLSPLAADDMITRRGRVTLRVVKGPGLPFGLLRKQVFDPLASIKDLHLGVLLDWLTGLRAVGVLVMERYRSLAVFRDGLGHVSEMNLPGNRGLINCKLGRHLVWIGQGQAHVRHILLKLRQMMSIKREVGSNMRRFDHLIKHRAAVVIINVLSGQLGCDIRAVVLDGQNRRWNSHAGRLDFRHRLGARWSNFRSHPLIVLINFRSSL